MFIPFWIWPFTCVFLLLVFLSYILLTHSFPLFDNMPFLSSSVLSACCMLLRARTKRQIMKWMTLIRVEHLWLTGERSTARSASITPPDSVLPLPSCIPDAFYTTEHIKYVQKKKRKKEQRNRIKVGKRFFRVYKTKARREARWFLLRLVKHFFVGEALWNQMGWAQFVSVV